MWQIVANLEFVTGFAIDLQTRKPNISPRASLIFHEILCPGCLKNVVIATTTIVITDLLTLVK